MSANRETKAPTRRKKISQGQERSDDALGHESQNTASTDGAKEGGSLPVGWEWKTVGEMVDAMQYGTSAKTSEDTSGVPVLRMGNIKDGSLVLDSLKYLPADHEEFPALLLQDGDLLFHRTNSAELVGNSAIYRGNPSPCACASYLIRAPLQAGYVPDFLAYYLNSTFGRAWASSVVSQQVGQANVNGTKLKALSVPVAPLAEQRRIVAEIEKQFTRLEAGVAALTRVQANLKRYRAAVLKAACEGKLVRTEAELTKTGKRKATFETGESLLARIRTVKAEKIRKGEIRKRRIIDPSFLTEPIESVPEGWASGRVEDFGAPEDNAIVDGPFGSNLKLTDYTPDGKYPVITITNIDEGFDLASLRKVTKDKFEEVKRSAVRAGDILVAKIGSSFGKTGIYPSHMPVGIIPANLLKVTPTAEMNWKYLFYHLHSLTFKKHLDTIVQYTAQPAFNVSKFKLLPVPVPPLAEQARIVAEVERRLSVVEELEAVVSANLQRATRLRQSILQKAFTGELV